MSLLFSPTSRGNLALRNRLVMAPMTRNRATDNVPNELMAQYYTQRTSVGLIITEGTSPSPNGLGYARIPGVFSAAQIAGWTRIADAVHAQGTKIFMQLMHCGRVAHSLNLPQGARVLAPSALGISGQIYTAAGKQPYTAPQAMTEADIQTTIKEFAQGARNAIAAGFDGIELHSANGYLLEQFIRPTSNQRTDHYGGPIENRARFVLEVIAAVSDAIGKDKVGIRLSPFGIYNDVPMYADMEADYAYLAQQLNVCAPLYVHLVDHSATGAPPVPESIKATFRNVFNGTLILCGGYDAARAEADLAADKCDLIGVARPILANPDLITRWKTNAALNVLDRSTVYADGPKGYIDYPTLQPRTAHSR